jgi:hypothetical protein
MLATRRELVAFDARTAKSRHEVVRKPIAVGIAWLVIAGCAGKEQTGPPGGAGTGMGGSAGAGGAALAYYYDHQDVIRAEWQEARELIASLRAKSGGRSAP